MPASICRVKRLFSWKMAYRSALVTPWRVFRRSPGGTKDITGGLPRVADLFEARRPSWQSWLKSAVSFPSVKKPKVNVVWLSPR
ncbi:hypothetical protein ACLBOM_34430 [Escherichia coli]